MFEGALCIIDCAGHLDTSNSQTSARHIGYSIWRKSTQMQLNVPSFLAFPSCFGFLPLFRHFSPSKTVYTASSTNELTTGKYLKMADAFCRFVSKQRLFTSWRSGQIYTYEGREDDQKEFETSAFESLYGSQIILANFSYSSYENHFFGFFSNRRGFPAHLQG